MQAGATVERHCIAPLAKGNARDNALNERLETEKDSPRVVSHPKLMGISSDTDLVHF